MSKFAIEYWLETNSRVEFFPATQQPDYPVTAVKIYVFQDDKLLLTNVVTRGWDLPGGHIEQGETPEQAILRELEEETGASVDNFQLIGYLKITNEKENERNKKYPKESCILVYKGYGLTLDTAHDFQLEASESKLVPIDQLHQVHHDWNEAKAQVVEYAVTYESEVSR
jgi:8-oxo-dGTP pyrophosphatase MutT (NUDIX family)